MDRLDILINNAGIGTAGPRQTSAEGFELRFAVNYLAGFLLTLLLLPLIKNSAPARIVNVSSAGQQPIDFGDVMLTRGYGETRAYCRIDLETGTATVLEPPVPRQGARRVWSDSRGALWITGWNSGDLFRYDSKTKSWGRWHLPGDRPQPYAVYVDDTDAVWVSDWGANAILRFDPKTEKFESVPLPDRDANVRQLAGRKGEIWGAESGADKLFMIKSE